MAIDIPSFITFMRALARVTILLRRLSSMDDSFDAAKTAAESALRDAIRERQLTQADVENLAALIAPELEQMSIMELVADVRNSLSALLVGCVTRDASTYGALQFIQKKLPPQA